MEKKRKLRMPSAWSAIAFGTIGFMDLFMASGLIIVPAPMIMSLTVVMSVIGIILW